MRFFVHSRTHGLVPFAHRIRSDGVDVDIAIDKPAYRRVWDGNYVEDGGGGVVLTDVWDDEVEGDLVYATQRPQADTYLRVGGWRYPQGEWTAPHLLIYDMGVWPFNMGALKGGGATLVHLNGEVAYLAIELLETLDVEGHQGLVEADLRPDEAGDLFLEKPNLGWNWLQAHAFIGPMENFGSVLGNGDVPAFQDGAKFTTVVPFSIPPWPEHGRRSAVVPIETSPDVRSRVFWHDVAIDQEQGAINSGGLDGLLGVARGVGNSPDLANAEAVSTVRGLLNIPELQWRPDVGGQVSAVLNGFEKFYGLSPWV